MNSIVLCDHHLNICNNNGEYYFDRGHEEYDEYIYIRLINLRFVYFDFNSVLNKLGVDLTCPIDSLLLSYISSTKYNTAIYKWQEQVKKSEVALHLFEQNEEIYLTLVLKVQICFNFRFFCYCGETHRVAWECYLGQHFMINTVI